MSRPSRGFTGRAVPSSPSSLCPSGGSTISNAIFPNAYNITATWSPDVLVGVLTFRATVNGGSSFELDSELNVNSGVTIGTDVTDYASAGDVVSIWADAETVTGCADFSTTPVAIIVT